MAHDNASSVQGVALRVTRLAADGSPVTGASGAYVTKRFVSVTFTPEIETGDEFNVKLANGSIGATWKADDTIKRFTISLALPDPDPELTQLLAGGTLLSAGGKSVGWKAPLAGVADNTNGCAIEVWAIANVGGRQDATSPYWHHVFPSCKMQISGERAITNDIMGINFEGFSVGNANFGDGPAAPTWAFGSDSGWQYARSATLPTGSGFVAVS